MKPPRLAHSYVRMSTDQQPDSERRQDDLAAEVAKRHNLQLSSFTFKDLGKSGWKKNKQKALDMFLLAIKTGKVKAGEVLIVESVDRLSRKGIRPTQTLVNSIFAAGIDILILSPMEKMYRADNDSIGDAIELSAFAFQANLYSELLSGRLKNWWVHQRSLAAKGNYRINSNSRGWYKKVEGGYELDPTAAEVIRYIFRRTIEGIGVVRLCGELNEKFPIINSNRSGHYTKTYIRDLIKDRAVLGEYQPHVLDADDKRVPLGDPISNYYPAIIDEETFLQAQAAAENRKIERGPVTQYVNLFTGLLYHFQDKCNAQIYTYQQKRADGTKVIFRRIKSAKAVANVPGSSTATVDIESFEAGVMKYLKELDYSVLEESPTPRRSLKTAAILKSKIKRLKELEDRIENGTIDLDHVITPLRNLNNDIASLKDQLRKEETEELSNPSEQLENIKKLLVNLEDNEVRLRLREGIKRVVRKITVLPIKMGTRRRDPVATYIEIAFHNNTKRFLVNYQGTTSQMEKLQPDGSTWELVMNEEKFRKFMEIIYIPVTTAIEKGKLRPSVESGLREFFNID